MVRMESVRRIESVLPLQDCTVHVWGVHVDRLLNRTDDFNRILNGREQERAKRYLKTADREAFIVARGALRILLAAYTGSKAAEIEFSYAASGKPSVTATDVAFNVSHSADWAVVVLGRNMNLGVDIERIREDVDVEAVAKRFLLPSEQEWLLKAEDPCRSFFDLWVKKEACVKARGSTLFNGLSGFRVPFDDDAESEGWFFRRLEAGSRYVAAVVADCDVTDVICYDFGGLEWEN
jgi:4'-phosphopantetheinyl transferase